MNILLTDAGIEGKEEFVTSPQPNCYFIVVKLTDDQSAAFDGNKRIGICLRVFADNHAGVTAVRGIGEDNIPTDYTMPPEPESEDSHFTPAQMQVLEETEAYAHAKFMAWYEEVKDDLDEFYALNNQNDPLADLRALLGI